MLEGTLAFKLVLQETLADGFGLGGILCARRADYHGNLVDAPMARNFNPLLAMAATTTIAEAEHMGSGINQHHQGSLREPSRP